MTLTTGTENLLSLAADLRKYAPDVRDAFHLRIGSKLMEKAADVVEAYAALDPDIEVAKGEN